MNALGETPWRINEEVMHVVDKLWDMGGDLAGLPSQAEYPIPIQPQRRFRSESNGLNLYVSLC